METKTTTAPGISAIRNPTSIVIAGYSLAAPVRYLPHGIGAWLGAGALIQLVTGGLGSLFSFWGLVHVALGPLALLLVLMSLIKILVMGAVLGGGAWLAWRLLGKR